MRLVKVLLVVLPFLIFIRANGQAAPSRSFGPDRQQVPAFELGFDYVYLHANVPPAQCGCFGMNGGAGSLTFNLSHGWSALADLSGTHANDVDGTTQNIGVFNFLFGGRYSVHPTHRLIPYAQGLIGGSEEFSSYTAVPSRVAFAAGGGGGVKLTLNRRFAWKIAEVDYIYSQIPNGTNNDQNNLRISSGIVIRVGAR
jgi:outer membrane immunogenic protein